MGKQVSDKIALEMILYHLKWSAKYLKAAREENDAEMKRLNDIWNPEKVLKEKIKADERTRNDNTGIKIRND